MKLLDFAIKTAQKAGSVIMAEAKKTITINKKGIRDLVTSADKASEKFIIKEIRKAYPAHGIIAEESASQKNLQDLNHCPYIWIIDPLDGTTNFAHGLNQYAVSIGIFKTKSAKSSRNFDYLEGDLTHGVVYAPALKELFYAEKGKGAYFNNKKIRVSKTEKIIDSLFVTGFPYRDKKANLPYFGAMLERCQGIRRFGAAALDMCYVAKGNFDAHWELGLKAWDIAAATLIVKEAGGTVTDTNGQQLDLFGENILASNYKIHSKIVKIFRKI